MVRFRSLLCLLLLVLFCRSAVAQYIWIEGEAPTRANVPAVGSGWGNKHFLSGEKWLNFALNADKDKAKIPADGIQLAYEFTVSQAGRYDLWHRVGYERVRSAYDWRVGNGPWQTTTGQDPTIDVMDIAVWCEVAWIKLGQVDLPAGSNTIEFRLPVQVDDPQKPGKILHASDVILFTAQPFIPHGAHRPDAEWQTDQDRQAAAVVYNLPAPKDTALPTQTELQGLWQIARSDEMQIDDRTGPITQIPPETELFWKAISVPGSKNAVRDDMNFAHRVFYRTRINVPAESAGRSFILQLPSYALLATVFVNGQPCGFGNAPFTMFECDITRAIKPGQVNEIVIGIKDNYYGLTGDTRASYNIPPTVFTSHQGTTQRLDFPVRGTTDSGLLRTPVLVTRGPVYTADVFAKPSVSNRQLGLEITLNNPTAQQAVLTIHNAVIPLAGGAAEKVFASKPVTVAAGTEITLELAEEWANPRLWWPDDPHQYQVVTTLEQSGRIIDTRHTKFGFREWGWNSDQFTLNGIPWHGFADITYHHLGKDGNPDKALAFWRKAGKNMWRFWGHTWGNMQADEALDFMDRNGVVVRRSGLFDGQVISYAMAMHTTGPDGKQVRVANQPLFDNVQRQLLAQIKTERNHPSILIWSIENEIIFINANNTGTSALAEPAIRKVAESAMALDPTRPVMVDGGHALLDDSLPVHGAHYLQRPQREYPDAAYTWDWARTQQAGGQKWPLTPNKPIFLGEQFFALGNDPAWYAGIDGEKCFLGRGESRYASYLFARMLSEGYRWTGTAAFHYWFEAAADDLPHHKVWQPVVVLCRQWNWSFASGDQVQRLLKVINDTRFDEPIDVTCQLVIDGQIVQTDQRTFSVPPGTGQEFTLTLQMPTVTKRTAGEFILIASRGGKEIWRDAKPVSVLNIPVASKPPLTAEQFVVFDPNGQATARLNARGIPFTAIQSPADIPATAKVVLLGADALDSIQATNPMWIDLAARGMRVVALEQDQPLRYQAIPADLHMTPHDGRIAFMENTAHPVFAGLEQQDFFCWSGDHVVWKKAYRKASRGAMSLVQCDESLRNTAMALLPVNEGMLLLSQLVIGQKLETEPVAQILFDNLINYAAQYELVQKRTVAAVAPDSLEGKLLRESGLEFDISADPLKALTTGKHQIAIVAATPANLRKLAEGLDQVRAFTESGGWLMLWGLTPDGLADYNRLVGVDHVIRPFERERVSMPIERDPLTVGLTNRDVTLQAGAKIFAWRGDRWAVDDTFSYVVDLAEVAPFALFNGEPVRKREAGSMHPRNMINGFHSDDAWRYIVYFERREDETWPGWTVTLPRPEELTGLSIMLNGHYRFITRLDIYFDDDPQPVSIDLEPTRERQEIILPQRPAVRTLRFAIASVDNSSERLVTGVDNIWLHARRDPQWHAKVTPLLNIGALVKYPQGEGGIILNQVQVLNNEQAPENASKKATLVTQILRNLGATFTGGKSVLQERYTWAPVHLGEQYNQYITRDEGWFDDPRGDLSGLPTGDEVRLGGVTFAINAFTTSPVPSCVMLAGPGAKGKLPREVALKVSVKADALAFLHTAREGQPWTPRPRREEEPPVVFKYQVTYADGATETVPVQLYNGVGSWVTSEPAGVRDGALAWAGKLSDGAYAAVYTLKWTNPRPQSEITEIKLMYEGNNSRYAVPALLGISAGTK